MIYLGYTIVFFMLLSALAGAMIQMSFALDEADIPGFSVWTSIACVIAGLPIMLW